MRVFRGIHRQGNQDCALTIGNFDGVHRGHQAMIALLRSEAAHRGVPAVVMSFEPHPRDYFAAAANKPELAPARIGTLRDKLAELRRCGVDEVAMLRFDTRLASLSAQAFIDQVLVQGLRARYVLVGDDFRFGAKRAGDYAMLDAAGEAAGFDVARMMSYEVHGVRVSSSAVRKALCAGDMSRAAALLGRPYAVSGHVLHGQKLGRSLGFRTLNLGFAHAQPAASGIFVAQVSGLTPQPLPAVASFGVRPSVEDAGRVLLEAHVLQWPESLPTEAAYGRVVSVALLHKLHDELKYDGLTALQAGIAQDTEHARQWWATHRGELR